MGAILEQIAKLQAEQLGTCPVCGRTLTHWRGRHTGRWVVSHPMAMCSLAHRESEAEPTQEEARDGWMARHWRGPVVVRPEVEAAIAAPKRQAKRGRGRKGGE